MLMRRNYFQEMVEQGDRIFGMKKYLRDKYQYKRKSDFFQYLSLFLLGAR